MGLPDTHPSMRLRHPPTAKAPGRSLARRGFRDRNPAVSGDLPDSGPGGSRPRWALSECAVIRPERRSPTSQKDLGLAWVHLDGLGGVHPSWPDINLVTSDCQNTLPPKASRRAVL